MESAEKMMISLVLMWVANIGMWLTLHTPAWYVLGILWLVFFISTIVFTIKTMKEL